MKKSILLFVFALFTLAGFAQAPKGLNYQGVARNSGGTVFNNGTPVSVTFSIRDGSAFGNIVFTETQSATTNQYGLFNLTIGSVNSSSFGQIPWASGPKYLEVNINANNTQLPGVTTQLMSVPYALYAEKTDLQAGTGISVSGNTVNNTGDTNPNDDVKIGDAAGGGLAGTYPNPSIGANSVGTNQIINGSITSADLAPGIIPSPVETYIFEERYPHNTTPTTWSNTTDGKPLANAFNTRKVNTQVYPAIPDPNSNVTLSPSTGQITFKAGVYLIQASAPAFIVSWHQLFLQDVSNDKFLLTGTDEFSNVTTNGHSRSFITGVLVVTGASKTTKLAHYLGTTDVLSGGVELGPKNPAGTGNPDIWTSQDIKEVYTTILIQKIQ